MKTLLMMALSIAVSASAPAINTKKIKNERVLASSGAHYISIGSNGCAGDEDDCVIYRFVDAVTGETLKTFAGHLGDESSRFHTGAILLGLGDEGKEYAEAKQLILLAPSLREADQALTPFAKTACERGGETVPYRLYVEILGKQLGCAKER